MSSAAPEGGAANGSPLAQLRADYAARQKAAPARYVDIWDDGKLVAKLARAADMESARAVMRTMTMLIDQDGRLPVDEDDLADVIAMTTGSLHYRDDDGEPVALGEDIPLRFDHTFGQAIGVPDITTPRGAVFAAFSSPTVDGGPAELDSLALMATATAIAFTLAGMTGEDTAAAEAAVGEA